MKNEFDEKLYGRHNSSLSSFIEKFNNCNDNENLVMCEIRKENYLGDGYFINLDTGKTLSFDWVYFQKNMFKDGFYLYPAYYVLERRYKKNTDIYLNADITGKYFLVCFKDDLIDYPVLKEMDNISKTGKETGYVYYTQYYKIFSYDNIESFKDYIIKYFNKKEKEV